MSGTNPPYNNSETSFHRFNDSPYLQYQQPRHRHSNAQSSIISHSHSTGYNYQGEPGVVEGDGEQDLDYLLDQELDALVSNDGDDQGHREHLDNWMNQQSGGTQEQHDKEYQGNPYAPNQNQYAPQQENAYQSQHEQHEQHEQYEQRELHESVYQSERVIAQENVYQPEHDHQGNVYEPERDRQENPYEHQTSVPPPPQANTYALQESHYQQEQQEHAYPEQHQYGVYDEQNYQQFEQNVEQYEQYQHQQFEEHQQHQPEQHVGQYEHQQNHEPFDPNLHEQHELHAQQYEHQGEFEQHVQQHEHIKQQDDFFHHQHEQPEQAQSQFDFQHQESKPMEEKHSNLDELFAKEETEDFLGGISSPINPEQPIAPAETPAGLEKFADLVLDDDLLLDDEFLEEDHTIVQQVQEQPQQIPTTSRYQPQQPVQPVQPVQHLQQQQPTLPPVQPVVQSHHSYVPNSTVTQSRYVVTPQQQTTNEFVKHLEESKKKHDAYDFPDTLIHQNIKPAPRHVVSNKYAPSSDSIAPPSTITQHSTSQPHPVEPPKKFFEELPIDLPNPSRAARPVALPVKSQPQIHHQSGPPPQQPVPPPPQQINPPPPPINPYKPKSNTSPIVHQQPLLPKPPVPSVIGNAYMSQQQQQQHVQPPQYKRTSVVSVSGGSSYSQSPQPMYAPPPQQQINQPPSHSYAPGPTSSYSPKQPQPFPIVTGPSTSTSTIVPQAINRQPMVNTNLQRTQSNSMTSPYVPKAGPYAPQSQTQRTHSRASSLVVGGGRGKEVNPYAPALPPVDNLNSTQHHELLPPAARTRGFSGATRSGNIYKSQAKVMSNEELMHRQFPIFNWSGGINVVSVIPSVHYDQPPIVSVKSVNTIFKDRGTYAEFPGPLIKGKTKKKEIEKWLEVSAKYLSNKPEELLLNQVLLQLVKHDGNVKSLEFLRAVCSILNPAVNYEAELPISGVGVGATNAYRLDNAGVNTVFSLIQAGNMEKALEFTISRGDWALALVIANFSGPTRFAKIASEYARNSFPFQKSNNKVMHIMPIILKVIAGNVQSVIEDLTAVANEGEYANLHWREIVSTIAISGSVKTGEFLTEFGKFLSLQYHNQIGCDVSYILAGLSFGKHASFMVLLSGEHSMYTQIYEYILTCQATTMPAVPFPHLLSLKLKHACTLADYGLLNESQKYVDYINNAIKTMGNKSPYISRHLVLEFENLLERLNESGSSEQGWFGGKMGKVNFWGQIDKFIAGGDDTKPKKSNDNGVFSKFSPSVSRNTSTVDFSTLQTGNYNSPMTRMSEQFTSPQQQQPFSSVSSAPVNSAEYNRKPSQGYPPQLQSFPSYGSIPTLNKYSPGQQQQQVKGPQKYTPNSSQHNLHEHEHKLTQPPLPTQVKAHSPLATKASISHPYGYNHHGSTTSTSSRVTVPEKKSEEYMAPPPRKEVEVVPAVRKQQVEAPPKREPPRRESHEIPTSPAEKRKSIGDLPPPKKQSIGEVHHDDIPPPPPPPHKKVEDVVSPPPPPPPHHRAHKKTTEEIVPPPPHKQVDEEVAASPQKNDVASPPQHKRIESVEVAPQPVKKSPVEEIIPNKKEDKEQEQEDEEKEQEQPEEPEEPEEPKEPKEPKEEKETPVQSPTAPPQPSKSATPRINPYAPNANIKPKTTRNKYGPPSGTKNYSPLEEPKEPPSNFDMYSYGGYNVEPTKQKETVQVKQEDEQKEQEKDEQRRREPTRNIPNVDDSFDAINETTTSQFLTPKPRALTLNQFSGPTPDIPYQEPPTNQKFGFDGFPIPGSPEYTTRANSVIGANPPPSGLFSSRLSQSQQSQLYQQYEVEDDTVKDYVPIAEDEDDEDDEDVKLAKKKLAEKTAKLKKQQEQQQKQQKQQQHRGGNGKGEDGRWFNFLGKNNDGKPKPIKANLGEKESLFYYDEERKRWLDKTRPIEEQLKEAETPPPPMMKKKVINGPSPLGAPPTVGTSNSGPSKTSPKVDSEGANAEAPPPKGNTSSLATANLDNLLALSAGGSSTGRRGKRNTKRTRVNVMELSS